MRRAACVLAAALGACAGPPSAPASGPSFTRGEETARAFGVHEIVLTGNGSVASPFETELVVTFQAPTRADPVPVTAFYDGGDTWRARVYVRTCGVWRWRSACRTDTGLDAKSGEFLAVPSRLPGRLVLDPNHPRHWTTDGGGRLLLLGDTAYYLFGGKDFRGDPIPEERFEKFVRDSVERGVSAVRANALGSIRDPKWETIWADAARMRLNLESFQRTDRRLRWMLENVPALYVQFILFPEPNNGYGKDETFWKELPPASRDLLLRNVVARFSAWPQIFWLIANDVFHGPGFPNNDAWVREAGRYLMERDRWGHPVSTGRNRRQPFPFPGEAWVGYIHLEDVDQLAADKMELYRDRAMPVILAEDRYETYIPPDAPRYYFRRLAWAWLLSGGSFMYGGRWAAVHAYSETGSLPYADPQKNERTEKPLVGLDSFAAIRKFFESRRIDLALFAPDDAMAGGTGADRPKVARRAFEEFIVYHPNAKGEGAKATVDKGRTARVALDLSPAQGAFAVEWCRAEDGATYDGGRVEGGARREFACPWEGEDAVLRLVRAR